ncbi:MAG TPA: hypothetical protein PKC76_19075 [Saprospiraceae bacterium]|nr:hypothetical protein [Saprospiraceae bacterium]HMP26240.1 hypothetical protein [Saprospiraceae bacterium]
MTFSSNLPIFGSTPKNGVPSYLTEQTESQEREPECPQCIIAPPDITYHIIYLQLVCEHYSLAQRAHWA